MISDGTQQYHRTYHKRTSRWDTIPVLENKSYSSHKQLVDEIFSFQSQSNDTLRDSRKQLTQPELISRTIAKQNPSMTSEIVNKKKSRFIHQELL